MIEVGNMNVAEQALKILNDKHMKEGDVIGGQYIPLFCTRGAQLVREGELDLSYLMLKCALDAIHADGVTKHQTHRAECLVNLTTICIERGPESIAEATKYSADCTTRYTPPYEAMHQGNLAMIALMMGDRESAIFLLEQQEEFISNALYGGQNNDYRPQLLLLWTEAILYRNTLDPYKKIENDYYSFKLFRDELVKSTRSFMLEYPFALDANIALAMAADEKDATIKTRLLTRALTCFHYVKDEKQRAHALKELNELKGDELKGIKPVTIFATEEEVIKYLTA